MNHSCRERDRIELLRSPLGQAAYEYYAEWMRVKKHSVPPIETFAQSKLFSTFVKFAEYAQSTNIPNIPFFIQTMVKEHDISPTLWARDNVYAMYLDRYDRSYPPENQVADSIDFAVQLSIDYGCKINELFKTVPTDQMISFLRRRKMSPWFLVASQVFRNFLLECDDTNKKRYLDASNFSTMVIRVTADKERFKLFSEVTAEVGL